MASFLSQWSALLTTIVSTVVSTGLCSGVQNMVQGDDVLKSIRGGLACGLMAAILALMVGGGRP